MKIQRVYIDTSVIGGCFDGEFAPWSNSLMKDFRIDNFKHIVHFEKIRKFNAVNREYSYKPIEIRTPREVTNYGPEERDV